MISTNSRTFVTTFALCGALALGGCGGGRGGSPPEPPAIPPSATGGLDARPQNPGCVAPDRPQGGAAVTVAEAFPGPTFSRPTKVLVEPVADPRWFVLQQGGEIRVFNPDNASSSGQFLVVNVNSTANEAGLLGMTFHPDYPTTPEIFVSYTRSHSGPALRSVISRLVLDNVVTPGPIGAGTVEHVILEVDQPYGNHNGGDIAFGPDGMLYIGLGDGGSGGDPQNHAQRTTTLLGSFLRIDVIGTGAGYTIPNGGTGDNPFAANPECGPAENAASCPEIYAWGVRNPWRWSFDPPTGVLWAGDVGQGSWEEVDRIERAGNYGWRCREGAHDFNASGCGGGYIDPAAEYGRSLGASITGGFVYRGTAISGLAGRYVFGDFVSGRIWALHSNGQGGFDELVATGGNISSFAVDQAGELYYSDYSGRIMQLVPSGGGGQDAVPDALSDTGCVNPASPTQASAGLIPYAINASFWSDGAEKQRFIGVPDGTTVAIDGSDDWQFPAGTVLVKNFRLNDRLVETRHLMRHPDGGWAGYTYEWNASQTEATRVKGGKTVTVEGQTWIFPDEAQCLQCHTAAAGVALGAETAQLNRDFTYPSTGRTHNQLETLDEIMLFETPSPGPASTLPALADPADQNAPLAERARAYLHTNCAQCHRPGGPTPVSLDLRYTTLLSNTNACDAAPEAGSLGLPEPRLIDPGVPANSVLVLRMQLRDTNGMPPIASARIDNSGVTLVSDWINSIASCN